MNNKTKLIAINHEDAAEDYFEDQPDAKRRRLDKRSASATGDTCSRMLTKSEIELLLKKSPSLTTVIDFLQSDDPQAQSATSEDYKTNTLKELYQLLEGAVKNEDYESAAKIRDEISKRD